jgi:hypothetical protein
VRAFRRSLSGDRPLDVLGANTVPIFLGQRRSLLQYANFECRAVSPMTPLRPSLIAELLESRQESSLQIGRLQLNL